jgi:hypothetical protein
VALQLLLAVGLPAWLVLRYIAGTRVVHGDGEPRLPGWAKAWVALQVLLAVGLPAWLVLRYIAGLQAAMLQATLLQG